MEKLYLLIVTFLIPISMFGQDTLKLEPVSVLNASNITYLENDLLLVSQDNYSEEIMHYYDISDPRNPEIITSFSAIPFIQHNENAADEWIPGATVYEDQIIWSTTELLSRWRPGYPEIIIEGPALVQGIRINGEPVEWAAFGILGIYDRHIHHPGDMVVYDHYLIVCSGDAKVKIFDLSQNEPELVTLFDYHTDRVSIVGDRLIIQDGWTLNIYDINDPRHPDLVGEMELNSEEYPYGIYPLNRYDRFPRFTSSTYVTKGNFLFLPNIQYQLPESSILVLDVTAEDAPAEVARIDLGGQFGGYDFGVSNDQLIVNHSYVDVYDMNDDFEIELAYTVSVDPGSFTQFRVHNSKLLFGEPFYYRNPFSSTKIYDLSPVSVNDNKYHKLPSAFILNSYPNPFNSSTTIEYRVGANSNSPVRLSLYDLSGHLVQTLVNERLMPGNYRTTLNANNLSAGMYVVRMEGNAPYNMSGHGGSSKKVLVVK